MARPQRTMFEKIWATHVIAELPGGDSLLHVDRHLMHELVAGPALDALSAKGRSVLDPNLTFATVDHAVGSAADRSRALNPAARDLVDAMRAGANKAGIRLFDLDQPEQGIVHVIGPELGLTLPGTLIVCGDSHTCTHGGLGALAFGIGTSEVVHVLASQAIRQRRPKTWQIVLHGALPSTVTAKDVILCVISRLGARAGQGFAIEFAGEATKGMSAEARMTLCNLSIELGAKIGMVAPDDVTFEYVAGRRYTPKDASFDQAVRYWRELVSDVGARFDRETSIDVSKMAPQVSWGTNPEDCIAIDGRTPDPEGETDASKRQRLIQALSYMDLQPGQRVTGVPIDWVFIGSCANGRLSDLQAAAAIVRGRKVARHVRAWVVPGSAAVRAAAEAEGLDAIFRDAGFEWRAPSCSLCFGSNSEKLLPGERSVSTTNRNFIGRQGTGSRTHIASPATAAASAIAGHIADPRLWVQNSGMSA